MLNNCYIIHTDIYIYIYNTAETHNESQGLFC